MTTQQTEKIIRDKNKFYTLIWLVLLIELAAFFLISYFILIPEVPEKTLNSGNDFNIILLYLSYLSVIVAVPLAYKIYDIKKKQIKGLQILKQKTKKYLITLMIIYSSFELAAILTLIAFYFNKMYEPLYMFGIIYVAVLLNKPSLKRFLQIPRETEKEHVNFSEKEKDNS